MNTMFIKVQYSELKSITKKYKKLLVDCPLINNSANYNFSFQYFVPITSNSVQNEKKSTF